MDRPRIAIFAGAVVLLGAIAYGASPFYAAHKLRDAARNGDSDQLEQLVDFPSVREHLKSQVSAFMLKSVSDDPELKNNPFAAVGAMLAPAITDRIIDSAVTPDGIATIINQGKLKAPGSDGKGSVEQPSAPQYSFSYNDLDHFRIALRISDDDQQGPTIDLTRKGLFSWQVTRINILSTLARSGTSSPANAAADTPPKEGQPVSADETAGDGSCSVVVQSAVTAVDAADAALIPGDSEQDVTQYVVSKATGEGSYCIHGGYCYPRYSTAGGKRIEALVLRGCTIGDKSSDDANETIYDLVRNRSSFSKSVLRYSDVRDTLSNMGLCSACADNAALYYTKKPDSRCAHTVKAAMEGNPEAKSELVQFPEYCKVTDAGMTPD